MRDSLLTILVGSEAAAVPGVTDDKKGSHSLVCIDCPPESCCSQFQLNTLLQASNIQSRSVLMIQVRGGIAVLTGLHERARSQDEAWKCADMR